MGTLDLTVNIVPTFLWFALLRLKCKKKNTLFTQKTGYLKPSDQRHLLSLRHREAEDTVTSLFFFFLQI